MSEAPGYEPTGLLGLIPWLVYLAPAAVPTAALAWVGLKAKASRRERDEKTAQFREEQAKKTGELEAKTDAIHETVGKVRDNVQNGHQTLMRDDLDGLLKGIREIRDEQVIQGTAIGKIDSRLITLTSDLSTERSERIAADDRLADQRK